MQNDQSNQPANAYNITYQFETTNKSFIDMYSFLRMKGFKGHSNKFFLVLHDKDLLGVDPRDPNLNEYMKMKILRECMTNYWYFIREVIRIPDQGGNGMPYKLSRGNLALNFCFIMNWNIFLEMPRQHGKTMSALCWYLWVFLMGTQNSEMLFMNKRHDDSKMNLARLKEIRDLLPSYLQLKDNYGANGKKIKTSNSVEKIENPLNKNKITTKPAARNKIDANKIGRGCTCPIMYYDEYAFIPYNYVIYSSATPALSTAAKNAKKNNAPYGILITTTPGDLTTEEGLDAFNTRNTATPFNENFYTKSPEELKDILDANKSSNFVYIKFTYQQLGSGADYFESMVKDLKKDYITIRREVNLEWIKSSSNSPFDNADLDIVGTMVKEPIDKITLGRGFTFNVYSRKNFYKHPPIIGVDVSGGYSRDASAITIIDSETTEVIATFNCNYISVIDLAKVIYELVTKYMPNAIVNIERNGGFGSSVLEYLLRKPNIKKNLYFEIKDKVIEERYDGMNAVRKTKKVKSYGFDETKKSRELLMEILRERMTYHKDKFIDRTIYDELCTLEVKRNGRIEHASDSHDDQIFSLLMALYVWYEGKDLANTYGIQKKSIKTDEAYEEIDDDIETYNTETDIISEVELADEVKSQLSYLNSNIAYSEEEFKRMEYIKDQQQLLELINSSKVNREAYAQQYNMDPDELTNTYISIPDSVFLGFYDQNGNKKSELQEEFDRISDLR